jgi:hypothetical protein
MGEHIIYHLNLFIPGVAGSSLLDAVQAKFETQP